MDRKEFVSRLRKIGISQKEFAKITGYSYQTVKQWNEFYPWIDHFLDYLELLKKDSDQFISITNKV
jgi:transcriptional regulator with XRE-family HTH domain